MIHRKPFDAGSSDSDLQFSVAVGHKMMEKLIRRHFFFHGYREKWMPHMFLQGVFHVALGTVEVHVGRRNIRLRKKRKALNMIVMKMGEKHMVAGRHGFLGEKLPRERNNAGAGVEDQAGIVFEPDFDAWGISPGHAPEPIGQRSQKALPVFIAADVPGSNPLHDALHTMAESGRSHGMRM
jgi:hypothetical protein